MAKATPRHRLTKAALLQRLASQWGQPVDRILADANMDIMVPGICVHCAEYSTEVEPDARTAWCERCGHRAVTSCLVLAEQAGGV